MSLMEIKQNQFDLLISGTPLPIVYAMRLGKSRELDGSLTGGEEMLIADTFFLRSYLTDQEIAILLIGAMSRKVNDVTDDEMAMMNSQTKSTLLVRKCLSFLLSSFSVSLSPSSSPAPPLLHQTFLVSDSCLPLFF